jgi:transcriptional regulator with XRE-family HTH domain
LTASSNAPNAGLLAQRLDELFHTKLHPEEGRPYTYREAAEAINELAGEKIISANYLMYLRTGQRARIGHDRLMAIARFFGVDVSHFSASDTHERQELLGILQDAGVRSIARHSAGLSAEALKNILGLIDAARRIEGLPPVGDHS